MSLSIQSLSKAYQSRKVLQDISFEVSEGEVLGIVGPNGAGKSTLLRIVSGIIDADQGTVLWKGKPMDIAQAGVLGYLPEERGLYPQMKILDQLVHFAGLKGMPAQAAKTKAMTLLEAWKMMAYVHAQAAELSKGNQQRIQFLASILHDPQLIILDEPFSGLDPVQADWLKQQVLLFKQEGKLVLYSSHRMESVEALCDRIMVLHEGQRVGYGTTQDLCKQEQECWRVVWRGANDQWLQQVQVIKQGRVKGNEQEALIHMQEKDLDALLVALRASGAAVESIQRHRMSLHEVFIHLTGYAHVE